MVGIPLLMCTWAPSWAVLGWLAGYVALTLTLWWFLLRTKHAIEEWWAGLLGLWIGLLPVSAVYWDSGGRAFWIAGLIVMIFVTAEVSSLPYIKIAEWRQGVVGASTLLIIAGLFEVGWVALCIVPLLFVIVSSADRMRSTHRSLEKARAEADAKALQADRLASRDDLTGLLNRRGMAAELQDRVGGAHTIVMVDANNFKAINDGHGHAAGDQVLQQMAVTLQRRLGNGWVVGRHGGDEFVAVSRGCQPLQPSLFEPVSCDVHLFGSTTSLRVALSAGSVASIYAEDADRALSIAAYAMRAAKRTDVSHIEFDSQLAEQFERMIEVTSPTASDGAVSAVTAIFQPIVDGERRIVGCEALARWRRDDGSLVPPDEFLPVLADNGQTPLVNRAMLTQAFGFAARFNDVADAPFVAVNIGSASFASTDLPALVAELLHRSNVDPGRVVIEITESEGLDTDSLGDTAAALQALGVRLAIDDFGSGYSNLQRLTQLPISYLKLDRSMINSVVGPIRPIARGVIEFARASGIGIIAEGIETEQQFLTMRRLGANHFQGYVHGRPMAAETLEALLLECDEDRVGA